NAASVKTFDAGAQQILESRFELVDRRHGSAFPLLSQSSPITASEVVRPSRLVSIHQGLVRSACLMPAETCLRVPARSATPQLIPCQRFFPAYPLVRPFRPDGSTVALHRAVRSAAGRPTGRRAR